MLSRSIAVIITTFNEEVHIQRAVESALPLGPVVVVDSGSADATRALAASAGAMVLENPWPGYGAQKNWARENLPVDARWVFHLDADEILTSSLRAEISRAIAQDEFAGLYVARRYIFFGRDLRHAWWYPDYQLRLFQRDKGRYEDRSVHEHVLLDGGAGFLEHPLIHEDLRGIDAFMERHLRYAALEAAEMHRTGSGPVAGQRRGRLFGTWPERRRAIKTRIWHHLPARPAIRFVWMYIIKRGFLDGRQGLIYCQLIAAYEALIDAKYFETQSPHPQSRWGSKP